MELLTLNANNQPDKLVENYDSLIWTERFNTVGDFQIITGRVDEFLSAYPEGTRFTLRESNQVMVVETHQIERKKNTGAKLTIKGRSYESILDRRVAIQSVLALTGSNNWTINMKTPSDLAYYIAYQICVVGSISAKDIFPASEVVFTAASDYNTSTGPVKPMDVPRGSLLSTILQMIQTEAPADLTTTPVTPVVVPHGIRAVRPNASGTAIAIQFYLGQDKTSTVYFDATRDLLDDGTYLFSKVGSANVGYGVGVGIATTMYEGYPNPEPVGLSRRVTLIDTSQSGSSDVAVLRTNVAMSLSEAHETAMFDGSINQDLASVPYSYGVDYNLGDIVKVVGDYGLSTNSRVTEYIRSEDASGIKAFPTLTAIQL